MGFIVFIYYVYSIGNPKEGYSWDGVLNECVNSKKGWMWGGMCDIPHPIEKKVPDTIDMFSKCGSPLVSDQTISTRVMRGSLQDC